MLEDSFTFLKDILEFIKDQKYKNQPDKNIVKYKN